jgi:hypothetical protein
MVFDCNFVEALVILYASELVCPGFGSEKERTCILCSATSDFSLYKAFVHEVLEGGLFFAREGIAVSVWWFVSFLQFDNMVLLSSQWQSSEPLFREDLSKLLLILGSSHLSHFQGPTIFYGYFTLPPVD